MRFLGGLRVRAQAAAAAACLLVATPLAQARLMAVPSYQQLADKSDLVVIAIPATKTADTAERAAILGVAVIGVETSFKIGVALKGAPLKGFVLHHYRAADSSMAVLDGPELVSFDPTDPSQPQAFLMFLVRESDGRFAPTGGQTDPGYKVIDRLPPD